MKYPYWFFLILTTLQPFKSWALPAAARDLALGGLSVASVSPETAAFLNPAVLGESKTLRTAFTQERFSANDFSFQVSSAFPLIKDFLGMGLAWDDQAKRNQVLTGFVRDQNGQYVVDPVSGLPQTQILGFFTQTQNIFYWSIAMKLDFCSFGVNLKYFLNDFGSLEGQGWGWDAAFHASITGDLRVGATLNDVNDSHIDFHGSAPDQVSPSLGVASLAWDFWKPGDFVFDAEPAISKELLNGSPPEGGGGLEVAWRQNVFLRAGYNNQNRLSLGVGLVAHPEKIFKEVRVDYTYLTQTPDGYPSRLTLTVEW